jgi:RimJ/RimL family protein N-acetyltransferase
MTLLRPRGECDLRTARLRLVAITPAMLQADQEAKSALSRMLDAEVTDEWPPEHWEPHVYDFIRRQYQEEPRTRGWNRYMLLRKARGRVLIGAVGGFPKPEGGVEIGYSTLPSFQRQGYGTEAARALVEWLLTQKDVQSVSAQTYTTLPESIKVMQRCGMSFVGPGDDPDTVRYRRAR